MIKHARPNPYGEFLSKGAHGAALHLLDRDGRPLGERSAPAFALAGVEIEERISAFRGREGQSMNFSGYKQVMSNWSASISALRSLRTAYSNYSGAKHFAVNHLWRFARIVSSVPAFLVFRRNALLIDGEIPAYISGLYKIGGGPFLTSIRFLMDSDPDDGFFRTMTPEAYLAYTEDNGVFNIRSSACAAPPKLVLEFLQMVIFGREDAASELRDALPDLDNENDFFSYGIACLKQDYLKLEYSLRLAELYLRLRLECLGSLPHSSIIDEIASNMREQSGWVFGIGKKIFAAERLCSPDVLLLRRHQAQIKSAMNVVQRELRDLSWNVEWSSLAVAGQGEAGDSLMSKRSHRLSAESDDTPINMAIGRALSRFRGDLMSLESYFLKAFTDIQAEINESLGWARPESLAREMLSKGTEGPSIGDLITLTP